MAPVLGRERRAVGAPEHFVVDVRALPGDASPDRSATARAPTGVPSARVWWISGCICLPISAAGDVVAEQARARRVAEDADAAQVDAVDRLRRRIEQQADPLLALGDLLARPDERGDVARDPRDADDGVARVADRRERDRHVDDRAVLAQPLRLEALDGPSRRAPAAGSSRSRPCVRPGRASSRAGRSPPRRCSRRAAPRRGSSVVMMPSSVLPMIASSDDSTIADSCASRARACSSAEMSVSVSTTPSGGVGGSAPSRNGPGVLSRPRRDTAGCAGSRQRCRLSQVCASTVMPSRSTRSMSAIRVGYERSCEKSAAGGRCPAE